MATGVIVQKGVGRKQINWARLLARLAAVVGAVLVVGYLGVSAYAADKVTHAARINPGTCDEFGLTCRDVEFTSTVDSIPLRGWFIDSAGNKTVLIVHGRDGVRSDKTIGIMDITKALQAHGYDVLLYSFELENRTATADVLTGVSSPDGRASIHRSEVDGAGRSRMTPVDRLPLPARSTVEFEPGGLHVMLDGIERELQVGDTVRLELEFDTNEPLTVEVLVVEPLSRADGDHDAGHRSLPAAPAPTTAGALR